MRYNKCVLLLTRNCIITPIITDRTFRVVRRNLHSG